MEAKWELSSSYFALLDQIRVLFSRQNLCSSLYLSKYLKNSLILPLYVVAEERRIAALIKNEKELPQAIQESGMARMAGEREVEIIQFPTMKVTASLQLLGELQLAMKEKGVRFSASPRFDNSSVNLTIYSEDYEFLEKLIKSKPGIEFSSASLIEDIRIGAARARKNKSENGRTYGKITYTLDKPPQIFIRRAVNSESQDEKPQEQQRKKKYKQSGRDLREKQRQKPQFTINNQDFPSLP